MLHTHTHTHTQNTLVPDQLSRKSLWYCTPTYATCTSGSSHVLLPQGIKLKLALKRLSAVTIMWAYCFQWLATDTITPDIWESQIAMVSYRYNYTWYLRVSKRRPVNSLSSNMTSWGQIEMYRNFVSKKLFHLRNRLKEFRNKMLPHYFGKITHAGSRSFLSPYLM